MTDYTEYPNENKMRRIILTASLLIIVSGLISSQEISFPELKGFKLVKDYPVFVPDNLWDFINGAADTYLSYEFVDLNVAEYKKGKNSIKVEIYRHSNNTMAFGIYSTERSPYFDFIGIGAQGYKTDGAINFFKGDYYVKIRTYSEKKRILESTEEIAFRVSEMLEGDNSMPELLSLFPETGKKRNEEVYINESVLGHSFLNRAFRANYEAGEDVFSIFIIKNNDFQETWQAVNTWLSAVDIDTGNSETGKYLVNDKYNGDIFLSWRDKTIVFISGLTKDKSDVADKYTSEMLK
jgi:hypothetical protein